jgi:hypothetical protein
MFAALERAEIVLPGLLVDTTEWKDVDVDYHPPRVERLWRQWGNKRVYLHRIHPCRPHEALFHPHPWPSAMVVLAGRYEMTLGFGVEKPLIMTTIIMVPGSRYEMTHPDAWHYVRPVNDIAWSLMVSGPPWQRDVPKSDKPLRNLLPEAREEILDFFRRRFR